jgi:hypothetical protein
MHPLKSLLLEKPGKLATGNPCLSLQAASEIFFYNKKLFALYKGCCMMSAQISLLPPYE